MKVFERTGLDWILVLVNEERFFPRSAKPNQATEGELAALVDELPDVSVDEALQTVVALGDVAAKRWEGVEAKAGLLIQATTVVSLFTIGFAEVTLNASEDIASSGGGTIWWEWRMAAIVLYILIAFSLFMTVILSNKTLSITSVASTRIEDLLGLRDGNRETFYKQRIVSLLLAHRYTMAAIDDKVTYLRGAQEWFNRTLVLALLLLVVTLIATVPSLMP